jgi:hypothetical protein
VALVRNASGIFIPRPAGLSGVDVHALTSLVDASLHRADDRMTPFEKTPEDVDESARRHEGNAGPHRHEHVQAGLTRRFRVTNETDVRQEAAQRQRELDGVGDRRRSDVEVERDEFSQLERVVDRAASTEGMQPRFAIEKRVGVVHQEALTLRPPPVAHDRTV